MNFISNFKYKHIYILALVSMLLFPAYVRGDNVPFGMHTGITRNEFPQRIEFDSTKYANALDLGIGWERPGINSTYPFNSNLMDKVYGNIPPGINIIGNIYTPRIKGTFEFKILEEEYINYVKQIVERYDGDGIDDMPGLKNPIKHWQIDNEPPFFLYGRIDKIVPPGLHESGGVFLEWLVNSRDDYANVLKLASISIKSACPECKVIIGGIITPPNDKFNVIVEEFVEPILKKLQGKYIDIIDFHNFQRFMHAEKCYNTIRAVLDKYKYKDTEIWILETGTYSGKHKSGREKLEKEQAAELVKLLTYPLGLGVKKTLWAWAMVEGSPPLDDNDIFDHTGIIYDGVGQDDPGYGVKKLAYYSYKLLVDKMNDVDWASGRFVKKADGIYVLRFMKNNGVPVWIAWTEKTSPSERHLTFTLPVEDVEVIKITQSVPAARTGADLNAQDYPVFFRSGVVKSQHGNVTIKLDKIPVFIEAQ